MRGGGWLLGAALAGVPPLAEPCVAQEFDPATLDLAALIECRGDIPSYNRFAFWLAGEPGAAERLGWRLVETDNLFLQQYEMDRPVPVFGRSSKIVAFTATGPMAVLDGVGVSDLAGELGIAATVATGEKFLGERVIVEENETVDGVTYATRVSLNVSTVDTHPGKALAGCSYAVEVK